MKVKVWRSGNKLGIYIPSKVARELRINAGDELYVVATDGAIILSKEQKTALAFALSQSFSLEDIATLFQAIAERVEFLGLKFEELKQKVVETGIWVARRMRVVEVEEWGKLPEREETPEERGWIGYGDEKTHAELIKQLRAKIQERARTASSR